MCFFFFFSLFPWESLHPPVNSYDFLQREEGRLHFQSPGSGSEVRHTCLSLAREGLDTEQLGTVGPQGGCHVPPFFNLTNSLWGGQGWMDKGERIGGGIQHHGDRVLYLSAGSAQPVTKERRPEAPQGSLPAFPLLCLHRFLALPSLILSVWLFICGVFKQMSMSH